MLTTETIKLWRNNAEITAGETAEDDPEHIAAKAILALTAELLANREAQPVLYASEETLAYAKEGEKSLVTWSEPMGDAVIPLFTAPPAPAVPDEAKVGEMPFLGNSEPGYVRGWNDCRAAILEGIDKPSTPTSWIACDDALPQDGENIITLNNVGGVYGGYVFKRYENGRWAFVDAEEEFRVADGITHWMPLPTAPEGGNNSSST